MSVPSRPVTPRRADTLVAEAIARTPADQYVIWTGQSYRAKPDSQFSRALSLVSEVWTPVPLREVVLRVAQRDTTLRGPAVRDIARQHQSAKPCAYLLVRRTADGGYRTVSRIPWPPWGGPPLTEDTPVFTRSGEQLFG